MGGREDDPKNGRCLQNRALARLGRVKTSNQTWRGVLDTHKLEQLDWIKGRLRVRRMRRHTKRRTGELASSRVSGRLTSFVRAAGRASVPAACFVHRLSADHWWRAVACILGPGSQFCM